MNGTFYLKYLLESHSCSCTFLRHVRRYVSPKPVSSGYWPTFNRPSMFFLFTLALPCTSDDPVEWTRTHIQIRKVCKLTVITYGFSLSQKTSSSGRHCPNVFAKSMPVLRHSTCRCHHTKRISDVFLQYLHWLPSASFPSNHPLHYCLLWTILSKNVAMVFNFFDA